MNSDVIESDKQDQTQDTQENDYTNIIIDNSGSTGVSEKLNDVIITQSIICLVIALGFIVFNLIRPEAAKVLLDRFIQLCNIDLTENIKETFTQVRNFL